MMIYDQPKKAGAIVIKKNNDGPSVPMKNEDVKTEDGEEDGRHAAAQDLIAAHAENSPQKVIEALSNFIDLHMLQKPATEPDGEEK